MTEKEARDRIAEIALEIKELEEAIIDLENEAFDLENHLTDYDAIAKEKTYGNDDNRNG